MFPEQSPLLFCNTCSFVNVVMVVSDDSGVIVEPIYYGDVDLVEPDEEDINKPSLAPTLLLFATPDTWNSPAACRHRS